MKTRDGYVENLLGGEDYNAIDTKALRLSGAWTPTDAVRVDVIGNYQTDQASGTSFKSIAYAPFDPATGAAEPVAAPAMRGPVDLARSGDSLLVPVMLEHRVAVLPAP